MFRMTIKVLWFLIGVIASTYSYDDKKLFSCDFTEDSCGIVNQVGMRAKWNRKELDIGGRKGTVMAIDTNGMKGQIARMISPYFELHRQTSGCLSLDLFISGEGPITFRVEEQTDSGFQKILTVRNQVSHWRTYDLDVDIPEYVRFVFSGVDGTCISQQESNFIKHISYFVVELSNSRKNSVTVLKLSIERASLPPCEEFVFEAHVYPAMGKSIVAVTKVVFKLGKCPS